VLTATAGLGFKTKLTDRIVFTIENTIDITLMRVKTYLQRKIKPTFGVTNADFETQALNNWSALSCSFTWVEESPVL
jgi:hypothetical protein